MKISFNCLGLPWVNKCNTLISVSSQINQGILDLDYVLFFGFTKCFLLHFHSNVD